MKKLIAYGISVSVLTGTIIPTTNLGVTEIYAQTNSNVATTASLLTEKYGVSSVQYALMDKGKITVSNTIESKLIKPQGLNNQSIYGIGSVSKMYTAAAVMSLVDKKLLDIDKPLTQYIPEFKMADERYKKITPRMLLNHSSGIYGTYFKESMVFEEKSRTNHDQILNVLENQSLKYNPGEMSEYCNDGFTLLEILVERVSKNGFSQYLRENFSEPLGLISTKTAVDNFDKSKLAKFYLPPFIKGLPVESTNIIGTGGIYSTAEELCKFGNVLIGNNEKLLSKSSVIAMEKEEYKKGIHVQDGNENIFGHGLGWDNVNAEPFQQYGIKAVFKGGDTIQYHSVLIAIPEYHLVAGVSSSGGSSLFNYSVAVELLENALLEKGIINEIKPIKSSKAPVATPISPDMNVFAGTYAAAGGIEFKLEFKDNKIDVPAIAGIVPAQAYIHIGDGKFSNKDGSVILSFINIGNDIFIQTDMYMNFSGLKQLGWKSFAFQKLRNNSVSKNVLNVWSNRANQAYYLVDDGSTSEQYYFTGSIAPMMLNVNTESGYAYGGAKIIDENTAINVLKFRDVVDLKFYTKDNIEYLQARGFTFVAANNIKDLMDRESSLITIQKDNFTKWYKVGSSEGKEITVDIPQNATYFVYDEKGACVYHSLVSGTNKTILPKNGKIGFAGKADDVFKISLKKTM
ncbi:MAG: serine hydrolase domain-containing protein [Filifactoraceae bacterium]